MADAPTPIRPREETLRRVDWLALAPWLLVLRAVGATIGWPLVFGAVGVATLDWSAGRWADDDISLKRFADPVRFAYQDVAQWYFAANKIAVRVADESWLYYLAGPTMIYLGWTLLGTAIVQHASGRLVDNVRIGLAQSLRRLVKNALRVAGALALLALPAACFALVLSLSRWAANTMDVESITLTIASLSGVLAGLPLTLLVGLIVYGAPLFIAAVVMDGADPFDAVSRTVAYVFQKPGTLAACVVTGWIGYCAAGFVISWLLKASATLTDNFVGEDAIALYWLLIGFFPAYFYCAGAATYLVMRHAVDGQPLDEIAQPSSEA